MTREGPAALGAAFGSGSSGSLFGASGSANFLSRATAVLATLFLASTLALAYFGFSIRTAPASGGSVLEGAAVTAPATPASGAASAASGGAPAEIPTEGLPAHADAELVLGTHADPDPSTLAPWESRILRLS